MIKTLLLSILLFSTIVASDTKMKSRELPTKNMRSQSKLIVQLASDEFNKSLPQTIDKYTKLIKVEADNSTLIYIYEINTGAKSDEDVKKEDHSRMEKAITKGTCRSSKRFLDANISLKYLYKNTKTKITLFSFTVNQTSCFNL